MKDRIECPHCYGKGYLTQASATIGDLIRFHRQKLGLTQQEVAVSVELSRPQIANLEASRTDIPSAKLRKFADTLKCCVSDLVP